MLIEKSWVEDALVAQSERQRAEMWRLRESIPKGEKRVGGSDKHDISVPLAALGIFLERGAEAVARHNPGFRLSVYGHVGDSNVHFNILVPPDRDRLDFTRKIEAGLSHVLYEIALARRHVQRRARRGALEARPARTVCEPGPPGPLAADQKGSRFVGPHEPGGRGGPNRRPLT